MASTKQEQEIRNKKRKLEEELTEISGGKNSGDLRRVSEEYHKINEVVELLDRRLIIESELKNNSVLLKSENDSELKLLAETEQNNLNKELTTINEAIEEYFNPADPLDQKNIIVEIRAAAGGDESALFASELFRMYARYAEKHGWKTKLMSSSKIGLGGFKEVIFSVEGDRVYSRLKYESGVHRVQRVPDTEKSGRVHTSTVTVVVMPEADEVDVKLNPDDLEIKASTAGGHGGQSVNTTYSAVRIVHKPTGLTVQCQDERNFQQNKLRALQVLRARLLALELKKQQEAQSNKRKTQIGTGDRSEKIRTYNFPQDRITDHRLINNFNGANDFMDGNLDEIINKLKTAERAEQNNQ